MTVTLALTLHTGCCPDPRYLLIALNPERVAAALRCGGECVMLRGPSSDLPPRSVRRSLGHARWTTEFTGGCLAEPLKPALDETVLRALVDRRERPRYL